jgi:hypothetical protein
MRIAAADATAFEGVDAVVDAIGSPPVSPYENARIAPTTFDQWLAAGARYPAA